MNEPVLTEQQNEYEDDPLRHGAAGVRLMFRMSIFGTVAGTLIALAVGSYYWIWHDSTTALAWMLYFLLVAVSRVVVFLTYRRADDIDSNPDSWILAAGFTMLASGLGWGAAPLLFMDLNPVPTVATVTAMGMTGILLLAPSTRVMVAFNAPLFAGLLFGLVSAGEPAYWLTALALALCAGAMVVNALQMQASIRDSLRLAAEKERMVSTVARTRNELDTLSERVAKESARREQMQDEVKAAKIAAEAANMAKDEFLATMSHEIRTPLNGILPILDILRGTELNANQRDYLNTAFSSSKHLLSIIDDILDYSKIEAGKLELETVGINLRELLDSVVRLMSGSAQKKGVELKAIIEKDVRLAMRGDPVRLRQVLANLVSNAIKFTDQGSVTLSISKRQDFASETELLFTVRDTGIGMEKTTAERLFKPFSQADASTTRTYGGTGLGLAICKRLVEMMDGRIGVKSQPGKGSVFWFTARLKKSVGDIAGQQRQLTDSKALMVTTDADLKRRLEVFANRWELKPTFSASLNDAGNRLKNAAELGASWRFENLVIDTQSFEDRGEELVRQTRDEPRLAEMGILLLNDSGEVPASLGSIQHLTARLRSSSEGAIRDALETLLAGGGSGVAESVSDQELSYATDGLADDLPLEGTVLLVEDNPVNLHVAQKLLENIGLKFEVAKNGKIAFEALSEHPDRYDAVLMDCMMPIMDGYTATREWRKHEQKASLKHKPIIAMTANAMAGDRDKCLNSGMDDYMSKPLNRNLLRKVLRKWINPEEGAAAGEVVASTRPEPTTREIRAVSPEAAAGAPAIDPGVLEDLMDVMGTDFNSLVKVYLEDTPRTLKDLARAASAGNINGLIEPAHSLKSTSGNLGALTLAERAKDLEHDAREGRAPDVVKRVNEMIQLYRQAAAELNKVRRRAHP